MNFAETFKSESIQRESAAKAFEVIEYINGCEWIRLESTVNSTQLIAEFKSRTESDDDGFWIESSINEMHTIIPIEDKEFAIRIDDDADLRFGLEDIIDKYLTEIAHKEFEKESDELKIDAYINKHNE